MSAYGSIDSAKSGLIDGLKYEIETKVVQDGETFAFGTPVFFDAGDEDNAYHGDATDASLVFGGVAVISQRSFEDTEGEYAEFDSVNVLTKGRVWVQVVTGSTGIANTPAYVVHDTTETTTYEQFTATATNNKPTGGYFRSEPVTVGSMLLAILEVDGINADAATT